LIYFEEELTSAGSKTMTFPDPNFEDNLAAKAQPPEPPPTTRTLHLENKEEGKENMKSNEL